MREPIGNIELWVLNPKSKTQKSYPLIPSQDYRNDIPSDPLNPAAYPLHQDAKRRFLDVHDLYVADISRATVVLVNTPETSLAILRSVLA